MVSSQVFMGSAVAAMCGLGVWQARWCLAKTTRGQHLVQSFGPDRALLIWRLLLLPGVLFGLALAAGAVNPIAWPLP